MTKYHIQGGKPLSGTITISGAKNAAVAIIPAALLVDGVCRSENLPQISDEDSSFRKDFSFLGALFLLLILIGVGDFFNKRRAGVCNCLLA